MLSELIPKSQWRIYSRSELGPINWEYGNGWRTTIRYNESSQSFKTSRCSPRNVDAPAIYRSRSKDSRSDMLDDYGQGYYRVKIGSSFYYMPVRFSNNFPDKLPKDLITCWDKDSDRSKEVAPILKDFIYKVNDSSKLKIYSDYNSIDEFFDVEITGAPIYVSIISVDTRETIAKVERSNAGCRFIVELTNRDNEEFIIRSTIKNKEELNKLIEQTVEALRSYPQFSKYADDLENII